MKDNPRIRLGLASIALATVAAANCTSHASLNRRQTPSRIPRAGIGLGHSIMSGTATTATRRAGGKYLKMTSKIGGAMSGLHNLIGAIVGTTGSGGHLAYAAARY